MILFGVVWYSGMEKWYGFIFDSLLQVNDIVPTTSPRTRARSQSKTSSRNGGRRASAAAMYLQERGTGLPGREPCSACSVPCSLIRTTTGSREHGTRSVHTPRSVHTRVKGLASVCYWCLVHPTSLPARPVRYRPTLMPLTGPYSRTRLPSWPLAIGRSWVHYCFRARRRQPRTDQATWDDSEHTLDRTRPKDKASASRTSRGCRCSSESSAILIPSLGARNPACRRRDRQSRPISVSVFTPTVV